MQEPIRPEVVAPLDTVSLNYRYSGAWSEVNTRIAQRQNAVTLFVTLATAIVTILLAGGRPNSSFDPNLFSLLLPLISVAFGLLNYKHDKTIALLRTYLSECEALVPDVHAEIPLPGYHSSERYKREAEATRRFHDVSSAFLVVVFNTVGIIVACNAYPKAFDPLAWPMVLYVMGALVSVWLVTRSTLKPHRFP